MNKTLQNKVTIPLPLKKLPNIVRKKNVLMLKKTQTQNKHKLLLVNKHLAKLMNHWRTIDGSILDSAFLSLVIFEFVLYAQYDMRF